MDTRGFLAAVVPWDSGGYVTVNWQRPDGIWPGRSCQSVEAALRIIDDIKRGPNNVFFCLSTQRVNSGKRSRANAMALRSLFMDIDIDPNDDTGKKYKSLEEAVAQLLYFCQLVEIPPPSIIIFTGGGIHVYWYSNRTLPVDEWQRYADALKAAALNAGLKIDPVVTADAARVLRVPGTLNHKYNPPRRVQFIEVYCTSIQHDFSAVFVELLELAPVTAKPIEIADAFKDRPVNKALSEGIETREIPPLPFEPIMQECSWLRETYKTGGKEHDEPQWYQAIRCATYLENGEALAHELGNQHIDYTPETTDAKWDHAVESRKSGWPQCHTIEGLGSIHCKTCPHRAKDKSPINIGYDAYLAKESAEELKLLGATQPPDLKLPDGFVLDDKKRLCAYFPSEQKGGKIIPGRLLNLFMPQISAPIFQRKDGILGVSFMVSTEKGKSSEVFLSYSQCFKDTLLKHLLSNHVLYNSETQATQMIQKFAQSWLNKLREEPAVHTSGFMGWQYRNAERIGFAYGNIMYFDDGTQQPMRAAGDDEFRSWYMPHGKREAWLKAANLLINRKRPELQIIIAIAFAAPLVTFTGTMFGAILSVWGEPGTSKSTAQMVAAAVWGHPKQTRESLNSTPKSIQGRLGRTRNLPAYWDDVQDERHQDNLFQTMFVASEGAEGGRLNMDATYKVRLEWQTLLVACSNASFVEFLIRKQKSTTAGMRRVFEVELNKKFNEPGMIDATDASQIFGELVHNYGVIGAEYAKILAKEHREIGVLVTDAIKRFRIRVEGEGDESYWYSTCGVLLAGAALAQRLGVNFDLQAMEDFLFEMFMHNRRIRGTEGTEGGSYDNTERALTAFLNENVGGGYVLFIDKMFIHRTTPVNVFGHNRPDNRPIYVQVARDERKIVVSKRAMREFLEKRTINTRQVFAGLVKFFEAKELKITMGAGTVHARTQELCFVIEVPEDHEVLEDVLNAWGEPKTILRK